MAREMDIATELTEETSRGIGLWNAKRAPCMHMISSRATQGHGQAIEGIVRAYKVKPRLCEVSD